jgi:hypothetical protein
MQYLSYQSIFQLHLSCSIFPIPHWRLIENPLSELESSQMLKLLHFKQSAVAYIAVCGI